MPSQPPHAPPDLELLTALFYERPRELGEFASVTSADMPDDYRQLLDHHAHMTVTVERFHDSPVDVEVLAKRVEADHYARKILLRRQSDGRVVQFGIVRINLEYLDDEVRDEILGEATPLGRILIQHDVMRRVQLCALWKVAPGTDLQKLLEMEARAPTYGRTALIECNGVPAIELLEIVAPVIE